MMSYSATKRGESKEEVRDIWNDIACLSKKQLHTSPVFLEVAESLSAAN